MVGRWFDLTCCNTEQNIDRVRWAQTADSFLFHMDESTHSWYLTNSLQLFAVHLGANQRLIAMTSHHITATRKEKYVNTCRSD